MPRRNDKRRHDAPDTAEDPADRGPGAHSGREQRARERSLPGTASAAEGYSDSATARNDPLRGLTPEDSETPEETDEKDR
ncbi:hypothetical protein [Streptantibioticus cattleyicolor]|uniref:Uncharacterized protein n=1 Tax=Streptantibioticus cattleyicolor (strain ATCC 35852 / DSM 46488 / JCM 4925 / NBRC 14057 / NRRL 8057) TaxID=1003195 RepID=F8JN77_STREN|nr:hypothetical protein [Streptantibioticus cattleyicolor]AEW99170.1 hypothetical protein SCATT_p09770 [Streptantibioticus cattleyicolor NRRL 8057 = DSM 46488]CCB71789.1 protein of unknown function [Streptantibioticus cattleyicolor NRRL 8057 = DSM 46488]